jgi:3-hydroxyacyl-CoA dehydrogenase
MYIVELEREAFLSLCGEEKTLARLEHNAKRGKRLKN